MFIWTSGLLVQKPTVRACYLTSSNRMKSLVDPVSLRLPPFPFRALVLPAMPIYHRLGKLKKHCFHCQHWCCRLYGNCCTRYSELACLSEMRLHCMRCGLSLLLTDRLCWNDYPQKKAVLLHWHLLFGVTVTRPSPNYNCTIIALEIDLFYTFHFNPFWSHKMCVIFIIKATQRQMFRAMG